MRIICLLTFIIYSSFFIHSQQKISIDLQNESAYRLFEHIERQTDRKVYCIPAEMDTVSITIRAIEEEPLAILKRAFENTDFQVSEYNNTFFILKGRALATDITPAGENRQYTSEPEDGSKTQTRDSTYVSALSLVRDNEGKQATSEYKIYEVGKASETPQDKVSLTGYVYDSKTGEPIVGVFIRADEANITTMTDAYGYYNLLLEPGRHELHIYGAGQSDTKRQIQLYSDGRFDIQSIEKVHTLREVLVLADKKNNVRQVSLGIERLQMKDVKNIPTAFGEADIMRVIMSLPGVKSVGEVSTGFNVRGGATDQNLILYNESTIYNPSHMFGLFSVFNPDIIKDMELYKSSIPSKYGGRISSVLEINSREGNKKEYIGSASLGLLTSRLSFEGPIVKEKSSFVIGGRTTYSDWLLKQLPEKSGYRDGKAGFYDFNATVNHVFSPRDNLYISGYYSQDRFRFQKYELYKYRNANASIKWRHIFGPKLTGIFSAGYDHYDYMTENTEYPSTAYNMEFAINQGYGKADFSWYLNNDHTISFGLSSLYYNLHPGTYSPKGAESLVMNDKIQREKALESALYVGDQWNITSDLAIDFGIRYSLFNVLGSRSYNIYDPQYLPSLTTIQDTKTDEKGILKTYHGPEFRFSARYALPNDWSVKAGVNSMRQYIHKISNTSIMSPTDTWKLSDMNIKPQKGVQFAAGVYKNFMNHIVETSVEVYYKTMSDYLDYRNGARLLMNHHLETDVLNTKGRAYGVELMVKKTSGKLNGWVSYTYSRTELKQEDKRITLPVNKGDWYPADFDKPHEFKLIGNYKFTHRYSFSLNCEYSTGRPVTLPVSKYIYAGGEYVYYSDRNKYRIPDYFRTDLSFNIEPSHHLTLLTHSTISFGVYNLTGRKNAHSIYYKSEDGKVKGYKLSIFGAPIPYVSYNIKF
ncbi:MAG TPA: TonB-dependent receptor [Dysgonomonas sp.]|nr:TonB-dependent receptor [Dysgonomonas sp.]